MSDTDPASSCTPDRLQERFLKAGWTDGQGQWTTDGRQKALLALEAASRLGLGQPGRSLRQFTREVLHAPKTGGTPTRRRLVQFWAACVQELGLDGHTPEAEFREVLAAVLAQAQQQQNSTEEMSH